ncbi:MAG: hypothetical protein ACOX6Q_01325 [Candidatus Dojkabacteria bacterium]|jgi:hypothetical protein
MKNIKVGISLIILGNILYILNEYFSGNETTAFGEFSQGLLLGLSVGMNLIGIILIIIYISKKERK